MNSLTKSGFIAAGYVAAFLVAAATVTLFGKLGSSAAAQAAGGMAAFGDSVLFIGVFAIAAVPPSAAALYWLRGNRAFWAIVGAAALGLAVSAAGAAVAYHAGRGGAVVGMLGMLAPVRILLAPAFGLAYAVAGFFSPAGGPRFAIVAAGALEAAAFVSVAAVWGHAY